MPQSKLVATLLTKKTIFSWRNVLIPSVAMLVNVTKVQLAMGVLALISMNAARNNTTAVILEYVQILKVRAPDRRLSRSLDEN